MSILINVLIKWRVGKWRGQWLARATGGNEEKGGWMGANGGRLGDGIWQDVEASVGGVDSPVCLTKWANSIPFVVLLISSPTRISLHLLTFV